MRLSELLKPEMILIKPACSSKDELVSKLVDRIYEKNGGFTYPREDVLKAIFIREKIGGTMLPSGLSIPHARLKDFDGFFLALGIPSEPLPYEGQHVRLMAVMVSSQSGGEYYLPTLAALTKLTREKEFLMRMHNAVNPKEVISIIKERDPELI